MLKEITQGKYTNRFYKTNQPLFFSGITTIFEPVATIYLLENSLDMMYACCEQDGKIVKSNELLRQFTSHISPNNFLDIVSEADKDDFIAQTNKAKADKPNPKRAYSRTRTKTGADRFCVWNIYDMGRLHIKGYQLFDVTSVTAHEYERLKQLLTDASFNASHDIRQPLSSLIGLIDILKGIPDLPEDAIEVIDMISVSGAATDKALNDLIRKLSRQI